MKITEFSKKDPHIVTCEKCGLKMEPEVGDIEWSPTATNMYYVVCPHCGKLVWLFKNSHWDALWMLARKQK